MCVLGAGTWGIVLAQLARDNGHSVRAWDFSAEVVEQLTKTRGNPRLGDFKVSEDIGLSADMGEALEGAEVGIIVVPSVFVRATFEKVRELEAARGVGLWVICSKGIEPETLLPLHEVVAQVLGREARDRIGVLGGPTHAEEVARGLPATIVAAGENPEVAVSIQDLLFNPRFRVYTQDDVLGVELGGALKNVIAIAAGISDGMGFGDNARAALVTRGLAEIMRLGEAMGAQRDTFMGLSGVGDLVVTTCSAHSRNHRFGELLAEGMTCEEALKGVGMVVEGHATARSAFDLAKKFTIDMPITKAVHGILYKDVPATEALKALLSRAARSEKE